MKCEICGAEAQKIKGIPLCDEHKGMYDVVVWSKENKEFLDNLNMTRMPWME